MGVFHTRTECGTAACIAGHVLILEGYSPTLDSCQFIKNGEKVFADEGKRKKLLGLTDDQAENLFYSNNWPEEFEEEDVDDPKVAARRIEVLITTGK